MSDIIYYYYMSDEVIQYLYNIIVEYTFAIIQSIYHGNDTPLAGIGDMREKRGEVTKMNVWTGPNYYFRFTFQFIWHSGKLYILGFHHVLLTYKSSDDINSSVCIILLTWSNWMLSNLYFPSGSHIKVLYTLTAFFIVSFTSHCQKASRGAICHFCSRLDPPCLPVADSIVVSRNEFPNRALSSKW